MSSSVTSSSVNWGSPIGDPQLRIPYSRHIILNPTLHFPRRKADELRMAAAAAAAAKEAEEEEQLQLLVRAHNRDRKRAGVHDNETHSQKMARRARLGQLRKNR